VINIPLRGFCILMTSAIERASSPLGESPSSQAASPTGDKCLEMAVGDARFLPTSRRSPPVIPGDTIHPFGEEGWGDMTSDRCALYRQFTAVDGAYRRGDLDALKAALGDPEGFPNCLLPFDLAVGDHPLEYAIAWSPLPFVRTLLEIGADPNYPAQDGFPSLIETLATDRPDKHALLSLLLDAGADVQQRGHNDWTPLHYAVVRRDFTAVTLLLAKGADPAARTRIDECSTPLEDAEAIGFSEAVALLRHAHSG
jgi:hypothetical protein